MDNLQNDTGIMVIFFKTNWRLLMKKILMEKYSNNDSIATEKGDLATSEIKAWHDAYRKHTNFYDRLFRLFWMHFLLKFTDSPSLPQFNSISRP